MRSRTSFALAAGVLLLGLASATACGSEDGGDPEDFQDFAGDIADAAEDGDAEFFTSRVQGDPYTCTEDDARNTPGPGDPELPLCLNAGEQFASVFIAGYPSATVLTTEERLSRDIQMFFDLADPDAEPDEYGPGGPRLYATASSLGDEQPPQEIALLTGLVPSEDLVATPLGRASRALFFEFAGDRWVIVGEVGAVPPLAVDLLQEQTAPSFMDGWKRYE